MVTADTLVKALIGFALTAALSLSSWAALSIVDLRERVARGEISAQRDREDVAQIRSDVRALVIDSREQRDLLVRIAVAVGVERVPNKNGPQPTGR